MDTDFPARLSGALFSVLLEKCADAVTVIDKQDQVVFWSPSAERMFGWSCEEAVGRRLTDLIVPKSFASCHHRGVSNFNCKLEPPSVKRRAELPAMCRNGDLINVEVTVTALCLAEGDYFFGMIREVPKTDFPVERKEVVHSPSEAGEFLAITNNEAIIMSWSETATRITGFSAEEAVGKNIMEWLRPGFDNDIAPDDEKIASWTGITKMLTKNGEPYPVFAEWQGRKGAFTIRSSPARDELSSQKLIEERARLAYLNTHDSNTGLPLGVLANDHTSRAIALAAARNQTVVALFVDVDRFNAIGDHLDQEKSDFILKVVTGRITHSLRIFDTTFRAGAHSFLIILEHDISVDIVAHLMEKMAAQIGKPVEIDGETFFMSASIGASVFPRDANDAASLIQRAKLAMHEARKGGTGHYRFYDQELDRAVQTRISVERYLAKAVDNGEFVLLYQPKIHAASQKISGLEALIRWKHPRGGIVGPGEFIPVAEETGLIKKIGDWALEEACRQLAVWQQRGYRPVQVSVNLSAHQITQTGLCAFVKEMLQKYLVSPSLLDLEITETVAMQDFDSTVSILEQLHAIGVTVSIDDFGTGHSSLSYLKKLTANTLKIDQSFIRGLPTDVEDEFIVTTLIGLAHRMGLKVVAEGVEVVEQVDFLTRSNCDELQGYYFSRPVSPIEVERFLPLH